MFTFTLIDFNMTPMQIAGNILTLIGMSFFFISSFLKKKRDIVLTQTGNHAISLIGQCLLGQVSGAVQDGVSVIRNIFIVCNKNNKYWNIFFIVLGVVLGTILIVVLQLDSPMMIALGFLPVFAAFQYSIIILLPNVKVPWIKASMACSCVCWTVYGLFLKNYSMALTNSIIFIATIIALIQYFVGKNKASTVDEEQPSEE